MAGSASPCQQGNSDSDGRQEPAGEPSRSSQTAAASIADINDATASGLPALTNGMTEKAMSIDDEEQARRIADQDMSESRKQTYSGLVLLWVAFQATGIIYGDIGTSPLYVFSATFESQPSWEDLTGALSVIIWALTLIVTVKYTFIVLRADDDGQGGAFALYSLLARHARIVTGPGPRVVVSEEKQAGGRATPRALRRMLEASPLAQSMLKVVGVAGVSLVVADGVLTPAQSVLGAVQGIRVADASLGTPAVVGTSCAVLVLLFALQPLGTSRIGTAFAPIVTVWLLFNLATGIYNLAMHDHTVLLAFSPHHALQYLRRDSQPSLGGSGWRSLGGILLAFTGVEALYADLGAFSRRAIQISWVCLAYPCLLVAYCGQAAFISRDPTGTAFANPFFRSLPPGSFYFGLVIAIVAAIVASQAMVTSVFQLLIQTARMSYSPHVRVVHTSTRFHEQVYVPAANWVLMLGTIIVTAAYNNTTSLGNAYGVCVILVAFLTTCMVALVAIIVWQVPVYIVLPIFLVFIALDGAFLSAALTKVPEGAWFTLLLASLLSSIFILWRFGKEAQWASETCNPLTPSNLLTTEPFGDEFGNDSENHQSEGAKHDEDDETEARGARRPGLVRLRSPGSAGTIVSTVPGLGIFFDKVGDPSLLPPSFAHFVRKFAARPSVIAFFHMRALPVPHIPPAERFVVCRFTGRSSGGGGGRAQHSSGNDSGSSTRSHRSSPLLRDAYVVVLRHGYADDVLRADLGRDLVAQLQLFIMASSSPARAGLSSSSRPISPARQRELDDREDRELTALRAACVAQTVFVLGKEALRVRKGPGLGSAGLGRVSIKAFCRKVLLESFLWIRENTRTKLTNLDIDFDRLVEVGFVKEI